MRHIKELSCLFVTVSCLLFLLNMNLPDISTSRKMVKIKKYNEPDLGKLGEYMVNMLPDDLAFTVFVPCEDSFEQVLKLSAVESLVDDKMNDTFAVISRVMGFSAVPRHVYSEEVPVMNEVSFDSISGYRLYLWRAYNGTMFVNNVMSEKVDMRKGEIVVHIMKGVVMDSGFAESFQADDDDQD